MIKIQISDTETNETVFQRTTEDLFKICPEALAEILFYLTNKLNHRWNGHTVGLETPMVCLTDVIG